LPWTPRCRVITVAHGGVKHPVASCIHWWRNCQWLPSVGPCGYLRRYGPPVPFSRSLVPVYKSLGKSTKWDKLHPYLAEMHTCLLSRLEEAATHGGTGLGSNAGLHVSACAVSHRVGWAWLVVAWHSIVWFLCPVFNNMLLSCQIWFVVNNTSLDTLV
jgi:hypothetical protein